MKGNSRSAAIVCAFVGFTLILGCHKNLPKPKPEPLRLVYQHSLLGLDPHSQNDGVTGAVLSAIFQPLVELKPGARVRPMLAESWTTPQPDLWRFKIRNDVFFHDGSRLNARDVVCSFDRAMNLGISTYLDAIESVGLSDDGWVEIRTRGPYPLLLSRLAMVGIVPEDYSPEIPVGTGAYRWVSGDRHGPVVLERWEKFWDVEAEIPRIRVDFVPDDEAMFREIREGRVDVVGKTGIDFLLRYPLSELPGNWNVVRNPASATTILGLNVRVPPLNDSRVRLAIDLCIDRAELVRKVMPEGSGAPACDLVPGGVFGAVPPAPVPQADFNRARKLMAEAGVTKGMLLRLGHSRVSIPLVQDIRDRLEMLGLKVELENQPFDVFYGRIEDGSLQAYLFGWNFDLGDASDFLDAMVHTRGESSLGQLNGSGYSNPMVDAWIEGASHEISQEKRLGKLRSALAMLRQERCYIPLFFATRQALFREPFTMDVRLGSWLRPYEIKIDTQKP